MARALVEAEVGAADGKRRRDRLPARRRPALEVGVGEESLGADRTEALRGMEDEDRDVPGQERRERRGGSTYAARGGNERDSGDQRGYDAASHAVSIGAMRRER